MAAPPRIPMVTAGGAAAVRQAVGPGGAGRLVSTGGAGLSVPPLEERGPFSTGECGALRVPSPGSRGP